MPSNASAPGGTRVLPREMVGRAGGQERHFAAGRGGAQGEVLEQRLRAADGAVVGEARADERYALGPAHGLRAASPARRCASSRLADLRGVLLVHALERGDEQAVDLVLLGPEPVGVELQQLPDHLLQTRRAAARSRGAARGSRSRRCRRTRRRAGTGGRSRETGPRCGG